MGGSFVIWYKLKLISGIVSNGTRSEDSGQYVEWLNAFLDIHVDEKVCENTYNII